MLRGFPPRSANRWRRGSSALVQRQRWLPVNDVPSTPCASPRKGWLETGLSQVLVQEIERQRGRLGDPVDAQGCSALVRTLRKALKPGYLTRGKTPTTFWWKAAYRAGQLANFLRPEETCEILTALADAKLPWKQDSKATEGLQLFAAHAAEEIGSFSALQMGQILEAFARLQYQHEELLHAVTRSVSLTVSSDSGRFSNDAAVKLLCAFQTLAVADAPMLRSLSRLFMRRIVREPLSPQQTAQVAVAFSGLQVRDVGLFNATTLGLCRPQAVEALSWAELAEVALAYASLRLYSQSLFGKNPGSRRIRHRLAGSSSLIPYEDFEQPPPERGDQLLRLPTVEDVWQSLEAQEPLAPPMPLPPKVVAQFLEAQLHLGQVALDEADPLLPHLAHSAGPSGRPSVQLSQLLLIFLARGHHALPYLWRRAVSGAMPLEPGNSNARKRPGEALGPMVEAFTTHLELLRPLVSDENCPNPPLLLSHLRVICGGVVRCWQLLSQRAVGLTSSQLHQVAVMVPKLFRSQGALEFPRQQLFLGPAHSDLQNAMEYAAVQALRRIHGEMMLRQDESDDANGVSSLAEIRRLLEGHGVEAAWVLEDVRTLKEDSIAK